MPEFTTLISTNDLSGTLASDQFSNSLRPVEVVSSLPTTGNFQGRTVLLTTDNKLHRYTGTSFTTAISAADLTDQINVATQVTGQLPVANANAGLRNSSITINADGSLSGAGSGNVTLSGIGAGALAAQDTVNLTNQVAGELSVAFAAAGLKNSNVTINADGTLGGAGSGQVSLSGIGAGTLASLNSITSTEITDGAITAPKIAAGQITAAKLNVSEVFSDSVVASNIATNSVTAANIKSVLVSTDKLVADQIAANTITADLIASRTILAENIVASTLTGNEILANSVNADRLVANSITAGKIAAGTLTADRLNVSGVFGDTAVIGAIQTSAITAAAIDAAVANFEFVESVNIASDAITAGKIAANAVEADAINVTDLAAISANLGTITAGTIDADTVTINNLTATDISGDIDTFVSFSTSTTQTITPDDGETVIQTVVIPANTLGHTPVINAACQIEYQTSFDSGSDNGVTFRVRDTNLSGTLISTLFYTKRKSSSGTIEDDSVFIFATDTKTTAEKTYVITAFAASGSDSDEVDIDAIEGIAIGAR